ncbi:hypothetical protein, partial [Microcoleus sp. B7-D4]|uniref:hypothetical protein n=1 Tax=Microcoleus sp. B7-D4 TaxID=2818696 RepID=UPI002FD7774C
MAQASCLCKEFGRARCPPHKNICGTGILPVKSLWHRHLACAKSLGGQDAHPTIIFVAQASCLCKEFGRARCPPHNNFCGT